MIIETVREYDAGGNRQSFDGTHTKHYCDDCGSELGGHYGADIGWLFDGDMYYCPICLRSHATPDQMEKSRLRDCINLKKMAERKSLLKTAIKKLQREYDEIFSLFGECERKYALAYGHVYGSWDGMLAGLEAINREFEEMKNA